MSKPKAMYEVELAIMKRMGLDPVLIGSDRFQVSRSEERIEFFTHLDKEYPLARVPNREDVWDR